ncbi:MAG: alpha/beta hydrolase [Acidimicrobiia bacterium]|nr:alpha/beta hydrolase [Acidimicrobiia bacterium]
MSLHDKIHGELTFDVAVGGPADGPVVFLLHGFPQVAACWSKLLDPLAEAGYRVVAPNQRGYSPRARPIDVEAYHTSRLVADVVGLADAVGAARVHLVGHDWGALVGWRCAVEHPERLASFAALSVPHPRALAAAYLGDGTGPTEQAQRSSYVATFRAEGAETQFLADDAALLRFLYEAAGLTTDEAAPHLAALGDEAALRAALAWYRANDLSDAALDDVEVPTLFLWSTDDLAIAREGAEATADCVRAPYRFVALDGVDHWIPDHAAEAVVDELLAWWAQYPIEG